MNREHDDLIDFGEATLETKGGPAGVEDSLFTLQKAEGLSDD